MWKYAIGKRTVTIKQGGAAFNPVVMIFDFSGSMQRWFGALQQVADAVSAIGSTLVIFSTDAYVHDLTMADKINWPEVQRTRAYNGGTRLSSALI